MNHRTLAGLFALSALSPLAAQSAVVSPSPRFASEEGLQGAGHFGYYARGRLQLLDGNLRGRTRAIREIAFRPEGADVYGGAGRSWTRVTLQLAESRISSVNRVYATNLHTTPTTVFQAAVSLPTLPGMQPVQPAPFHIRFPFRGVWSYSGTRDLCADFTFAGGALANRAAWRGGLSYDLDGYTAGQEVTPRVARLGGSCMDSAASRPAVSVVMSTTYGPKASWYQNVHVVNCFALQMGATTPAVLALGTNVHKTGVRLPGTGCGRLFLDPSRPMFLKFGMTDPFGAFGWWPSPGVLLPVNPAFFGMKFINQAAWTDTRTGALMFTPGALGQISRLPYFVDDAAAKRHAVLGDDTSSTRYASTSSSQPRFNPIVRYGL